MKRYNQIWKFSNQLKAAHYYDCYYENKFCHLLAPSKSTSSLLQRIVFSPLLSEYLLAHTVNLTHP